MPVAAAPDVATDMVTHDEAEVVGAADLAAKLRVERRTEVDPVDVGPPVVDVAAWALAELGVGVGHGAQVAPDVVGTAELGMVVGGMVVGGAVVGVPAVPDEQVGIAAVLDVGPPVPLLPVVEPDVVELDWRPDVVAGDVVVEVGLPGAADVARGGVDAAVVVGALLDAPEDFAAFGYTIGTTCTTCSGWPCSYAVAKAITSAT